MPAIDADGQNLSRSSLDPPQRSCALCSAPQSRSGVPEQKSKDLSRALDLCEGSPGRLVTGGANSAWIMVPAPVQQAAGNSERRCEDVIACLRNSDALSSTSASTATAAMTAFRKVGTSTEPPCHVGRDREVKSRHGSTQVLNDLSRTPDFELVATVPEILVDSRFVPRTRGRHVSKTGEIGVGLR